jgi:hypothetical protein
LLGEIQLMEPEVFLEQGNVVSLIQALKTVLSQTNNASERQSILSIAGINSAWISNLNLDSPPNKLAPALVAAFRTYRMSSRQPDYHPMEKLLNYLLADTESYGLSDEDEKLFNLLVEKAQENFQALKVRSAVGRIESPQGTGMGTGVLVATNLLLSCYHVFSKAQVQQAWVRFGYKTGSYGLEDVFELDLNFVSTHNNLDYTLVRIQGKPQQQIVNPTNAELNSGQEIRLIHHPLGKPVVISDIGKIMQVGKDYIDHNISADEGSSGAPIFNRQWELVAIHQGHPGIGRSVEKGTLGGIPIRAIWDQIQPHLAS